MKNNPYMNSQTICWDCANATGGCRWSEKLKPVKGWEAEPTTKHSSYSTFSSYRVIKCPEFIQDAREFGTKRLEKCKASDGD